MGHAMLRAAVYVSLEHYSLATHASSTGSPRSAAVSQTCARPLGMTASRDREVSLFHASFHSSAFIASSQLYSALLMLDAKLHSMESPQAETIVLTAPVRPETGGLSSSAMTAAYAAHS